MRALIHWVAGLGALPSDSDEDRLRKGTLSLSSSLITLLAVIWVITYLVLGLRMSALIPFVYQCASVLSLVVFAHTRRFGLFRTSQLALMLVLPFVLQWSLGGFRNSSAVSLWAFWSPLGAVMFSGLRRAVPWFVGFAALTVFSAVIDPHLAAAAARIPEAVIVSFFVLNILGVTATVFLLLFYFVGERESIKAALDLEKERSEALLLNVLPQATAERLKRSSAAIADSFSEVTILFADIVGFTPLSAGMTPSEIVAMLDEVFTAFDNLAHRHRLEKIKTIGDAYMVAGGVPVPRPDHAEAVAAMALDMLDEVATIRAADRQLAVRIGIDTGPVVAGVIGRQKFIYDLWGDAVNTASRMEAHGVSGSIHVTEAAYRRLRSRFEFEPRGTIEVKGKGPMTTYLLVRRHVAVGGTVPPARAHTAAADRSRGI